MPTVNITDWTPAPLTENCKQQCYITAIHEIFHSISKLNSTDDKSPTFTSLCIIPRPCKYCKPCSVSRNTNAIWFSFSGPVTTPIRKVAVNQMKELKQKKINNRKTGVKCKTVSKVIKHSHNYQKSLTSLSWCSNMVHVMTSKYCDLNHTAWRQYAKPIKIDRKLADCWPGINLEPTIWPMRKEDLYYVSKMGLFAIAIHSKLTVQQHSTTPQ